jgi:hypothetical protein
MKHKAVLFSLLALASVMVLAISAMTVFAFVGDGPAQEVEAVTVDQAPEVAPAQVESISQPEVVKPVLNYERASHAGKPGGCSYSSTKAQLTEVPAEKVEDQPLAQVAQ